MIYDTKNREWVKRLNDFTPAQQKILLALSHDKYEWRTRDGLLQVTGLRPEALDKELAALIQAGLVRPSFSRDRDLIFGLVERVS